MALFEETKEEALKQIQAEIFENAKKGIYMTESEKRELLEFLPEAEELDFLEKGLTPQQRHERRKLSEVIREQGIYEMTGIKNEARELDLDVVAAKYDRMKARFDKIKNSGKLTEEELFQINVNESDSDLDDAYFERLKVKAKEQAAYIKAEHGEKSLKEGEQDEQKAEAQALVDRYENIFKDSAEFE